MLCSNVYSVKPRAFGDMRNRIRSMGGINNRSSVYNLLKVPHPGPIHLLLESNYFFISPWDITPTAQNSDCICEERVSGFLIPLFSFYFPPYRVH